MSKSTQELSQVVVDALEDVKGQEIVRIDVTELSDVMDTLVIVTGTSNRHVKSLADNVIEEAKKLDLRPIGVEGMESGEWVLVDYGDVVLHAMLPQTRSFYDLEKLWSMEPANRHESDEQEPQD
ncbi:ribosome silencing factor [Maricurvus nonylphenolicus]|uniref:ribosome silencing factor n=1 Tax=Maricurvus nonylphenolicus TaxID=1008307 RepID=UPI0036F22C49